MMSDSENKYKIGETGLTMHSSICRCDSCKEEFFADFFLKILDTSIALIVGVCLSVGIMLTQKINTNATDTPAPWLRPAAGLRPAGGI